MKILLRVKKVSYLGTFHPKGFSSKSSSGSEIVEFSIVNIPNIARPPKSTFFWGVKYMSSVVWVHQGLIPHQIGSVTKDDWLQRSSLDNIIFHHDLYISCSRKYAVGRLLLPRTVLKQQIQTENYNKGVQMTVELLLEHFVPSRPANENQASSYPCRISRPYGVSW